MAYFVFCSKMESGYVYICYYCNEKFDLFKDIFNHLIEKHNAETFKIKKLKFGKKEGVLGYTGTTVNYKFKPLDDILAGKKKKVVVYMVTLTFNSSLLFYYMGNNFSLYEAHRLDN